MILTGSEISREVERGNIVIHPYDPDQLNPNSYNYRLGNSLLEIEDPIIDVKGEHTTTLIPIPAQGYQLQPNRLYLGSTYETIGSDMYVISLIGRSSLGRLGLFLQITADLGHIGTEHRWTLELTVVQPLIVYAQMRIGQISFWKSEGIELLQGLKYLNMPRSYAQFSHPQGSAVEKFFE